MEEWKSRSQKKREDKELQAMGLKLASLEEKDWQALPLSEALFEALKIGTTIRGHSAQLRHKKRIGKLIREEDAENQAAMAAFLHRMEGKRLETQNRHQQLESIRDRLASGDLSLFEKLRKLQGTDETRFLLLVEQARKEKETGKLKGAGKALYRYLEKRFPMVFQL